MISTIINKGQEDGQKKERERTKKTKEISYAKGSAKPEQNKMFEKHTEARLIGSGWFSSTNVSLGSLLHDSNTTKV